MHPLLHIDTFRLMTLWGDLLEAYHGVNGYSGDTAEIYAYRLMMNDPLAYVLDEKSAMGAQARAKQNRQAADGLHDLCRLFSSEYDCIIKVNGMSLTKWRKEVGSGFDHRCHVRVMHKKGKKS